jgi:hypothetical protein
MDYKAIAAWGYWPTLSAEFYPRVSSWGYAGIFGAPVVSGYRRPNYTTIAMAGRMRL